MKCPNCDGIGFPGGYAHPNEAWKPCKLCGGKGKLIDFAVPMFESVHWEHRTPTVIYVGADRTRVASDKQEAQRYTLDGARELVSDVQNGRSWFNLKPNCIVRVYLK